MTIQSIIFDKNIWSLTRAKHYLLYHNLHPIKEMHETDHYYRFRLEQPRTHARYITKQIAKGLKIIISM